MKARSFFVLLASKLDTRLNCISWQRWEPHQVERKLNGQEINRSMAEPGS
ncbi:hypothetical protein VCR3J2_310157 [Vibrio coralliirubri]|nr:hypothetical protein VCR3J2_310157 [Vibrio coralliirubri]